MDCQTEVGWLRKICIGAALASLVVSLHGCATDEAEEASAENSSGNQSAVNASALVDRGNLLFNHLDVHHSGSISQEDFGNATGVLVKSSPNGSIGAVVFAALDADSDGTVSREELEEVAGGAAGIIERLNASNSSGNATYSFEELMQAALLMDEELEFARLFEATSFMLDMLHDGTATPPVSSRLSRVLLAGKDQDKHISLEVASAFMENKTASFHEFLKTHHEGGTGKEKELLACANDVLTAAKKKEPERKAWLEAEDATGCLIFLKGFHEVRAREALRAAVDLGAPQHILDQLVKEFKAAWRHANPGKDEANKISQADWDLFKRAGSVDPGRERGEAGVGTPQPSEASGGAEPPATTPSAEPPAAKPAAANPATPAPISSMAA